MMSQLAMSFECPPKHVRAERRRAAASERCSVLVPPQSSVETRSRESCKSIQPSGDAFKRK